MKKCVFLVLLLMVVLVGQSAAAISPALINGLYDPGIVAEQAVVPLSGGLTLVVATEQTKIVEVAFLFRSVTNENVKALSRFLEDKGIMVYSPRSGQFFEREEIRLMIGAILTVFPNWREYVALPNKFELQEWGYYEQCTRLFAETVKRDLQTSLIPGRFE